jgi:hypothetical protein
MGQNLVEESVEQSEPVVDQDWSSDADREAAAGLAQKMSSKVRIQRWPGPLGPVVGPALIIRGLDEVAEGLYMSGFMKPWVVEKIKEHLLGGGLFTNKGAAKTEDEAAIVSNGQAISMQVRSEYRMATEKEVLDYVDTAQFASTTGHRVSKHAQEKGYVLHYHEGPALIEAYDSLPRQAKVILDLLNETGRENFTEASIEMVLTEKAELLKTKQEPMKIFGFYRRRLIDDGHLEEVE